MFSFFSRVASNSTSIPVTTTANVNKAVINHPRVYPYVIAASHAGMYIEIVDACGDHAANSSIMYNVIPPVASEVAWASGAAAM